jgi:hypothetical protein
MKQFWLVAAALLLTTLLPDGAFAQRGGFRGGAMGKCAAWDEREKKRALRPAVCVR